MGVPVLFRRSLSFYIDTHVGWTLYLFPSWAQRRLLRTTSSRQPHPKNWRNYVATPRGDMTKMLPGIGVGLQWQVPFQPDVWDFFPGLRNHWQEAAYFRLVNYDMVQPYEKSIARDYQECKRNGNGTCHGHEKPATSGMCPTKMSWVIPSDPRIRWWDMKNIFLVGKTSMFPVEAAALSLDKPQCPYTFDFCCVVITSTDLFH